MIRHRLYPPVAGAVEYFKLIHVYTRLGLVTRACLRLMPLRSSKVVNQNFGAPTAPRVQAPMFAVLVRYWSALALRSDACHRPRRVSRLWFPPKTSGESDAPGLVTYAAPVRNARRRGCYDWEGPNASDREWLADGRRPAGAALKAVPPDLRARSRFVGVQGGGANSVNGG